MFTNEIKPNYFINMYHIDDPTLTDYIEVN